MNWRYSDGTLLKGNEVFNLTGKEQLMPEESQKPSK